ncbi:MAG TPA: diguanylate cyclase, partial [Kineosporiaceae bacterium]
DVRLTDRAPGRVQLALRDGVAELDCRITQLHDRSGRPIGTVVVTRDVTDQVHQAIALEEANARLRRQLATIEELRAELAEQAVRDDLTGLHNRRYLLARWSAELERCRQDGCELAVLIIDADRFKAVNDLHGHLVGDQVLIALATALAERLQPGELLARYGGEEFVAVLPGVGGARARRRAEQMRRQCASVSVATPSGSVRVTVSIGVATFPSNGATPAALLHAADQALYRAKAAGRDRVVGGPAGTALPAAPPRTAAPR